MKKINDKNKNNLDNDNLEDCEIIEIEGEVEVYQEDDKLIIRQKSTTFIN